MSRLFASTATDYIDVTPSGQVPNTGGPLTIMALVKITANQGSDQWVVQAYNASNSACWGLLASGGHW